MKNIKAPQGEIRIGEDLFRNLGLQPGRAFILGDSKVRRFAKELEENLIQAGWKVKSHFIQVSEKSKDLKNAASLYSLLLKHQCDRKSVLFAVGGGVIGDLAGFVAGTYMRGIRWVNIPTTLLAQVDSAVGGKTGINHKEGKNLIGIFHHPALVLCNPRVLKSLPKRDVISGLGEVIKYALLFDRTFLSDLQTKWADLVELKSPEIDSVIEKCLQWKVSVVLEDEREEKGIREKLNFGHTIGHALEAEAGYGHWRHGEAVILGMRAALSLSKARGNWKQEDWEQIDRFLSSVLKPASLGKIPRKIQMRKLLQRMLKDKKARDGKIRFVLLKEVGQTWIEPNLTSSEISLALDRLRQ